ncbi:HTTM domain-containing protein [Streptomyces otsuchiensis]|uniref:HTTM domain-containing protein n=1 Tax=Streptomyces otsuchiensis TaxID=2681388 RepID=UPI00102F93B3|nr:HTTM domain-containing protein [Streptomyces otsuchiensis]
MSDPQRPAEPNAPAEAVAPPPAAADDDSLLDRVSRTAFGAYQTAVVRIAISAIWLAVLLRELPNRHLIWGPDAPWSYDLAARGLAESGGFSFFGWNGGTLWFELCYLLAVLATGCVLLGWRTRATTVLFALSVMSFQHRNEYVLNAGENIVRIVAIYLVLTRCAQVWSLDARRARRVTAPSGTGAVSDGAAAGADRTGPVLWAALGATLAWLVLLGYPSPGWTVLLGGLWLLHGVTWWLRRSGGAPTRALLDRLATVVHNGGLLLVMTQVCLIYATAGWYKVQGSTWQDGTAVYWSMHIGFLNPWPALTDLVTSNAGIVLLLTYATVAVQVAFPFCLLNRRVKNVLLCVLILEHLGIAVLMGLPFFSLAMIAVDLVFLPTAALLWVEGRARRLRQRALPGRSPGPPGDAAAEQAAVPSGEPSGASGPANAPGPRAAAD